MELHITEKFLHSNIDSSRRISPKFLNISSPNPSNFVRVQSVITDLERKLSFMFRLTSLLELIHNAPTPL